MSHTTTLKGVLIKDISALHSAVNDLKAKGLNVSLVENEKPRMYYANQSGILPYVLKLHDSQYDVGFAKQEDGSFAPVFDDWNGYVKGQVGAACPMPNTAEGRAQHAIGQLLQNYQKHVAINQAVMQGYSITGTDIDAEGNIHISVAA